MRQRIDPDALYNDALSIMRAGDGHGSEPRPWPEANPFTLDQLLDADPDDMARQLSHANRRFG